MAVIFPGEAHTIVGHVDKTTVGDGDPMSVAAQIPQNLLWTGKRALAVNDPGDVPECGRDGQQIRSSLTTHTIHEQMSSGLKPLAPGK